MNLVASDSRLSFGARWDCCPKMFPLAREDSVLEAELARTLIDSLDEDLDENVEQLWLDEATRRCGTLFASSRWATERVL